MIEHMVATAERGEPEIDHIRVTPALMGRASLTVELQHLVDEIDEDIRAGRFESALDGSLLLGSLAPDCVANFIRTAELLIATKRIDAAAQLARSTKRLLGLRGEERFDLELVRIDTHVDPTPDKLRSFAIRLLGNDDATQLEHYLPSAIDACLAQDESGGALELTELWFERDPGSLEALSYRVRELLRSRAVSRAREAVSAYAAVQTDRGARARALTVQLAIEITTNSPDQWRTLASSSRLIGSDVISLDTFEALLRFVGEPMAQDSAISIAVGVVAHQIGSHDQARSVLQLVKPTDELQRYQMNAVLARSAQQLGDDAAALTALREGFEATFDPVAEQFSEQSALLDPPATRSWLGLELARALRARQELSAASDVLDRLRQTRPQDPEVARLHAEVVGQSGGRGAALRQLEQLLNQQEKQRNDVGAARTLESMIRLAPGNLSLRNRLVETYLRRGRNDEAIDQLIIQGRILQQAGRIRDAFVPMRRGVEIATMVGEWSRVEQLFRLMIEFDPDDTSIRHTAVATYVQYGKTDRALALLRDIVNIAVVNEDPDQAIAALHQMLALAPNEPSTFHRLGELLASIGEFGQAERVYRRLATLVPDDPAVRAKRSALAAMARPG